MARLNNCPVIKELIWGSHSGTRPHSLSFVCLFVCCFCGGGISDSVSFWLSWNACSVDQTGLELEDLPASASGMLGSKACPATLDLFLVLKGFIYF